jgi:CRP-like cAMP-binding protein
MLNNSRPVSHIHRSNCEFDLFERRGWLAEVPAGFRSEVLSRSDLMSLQPGETVYRVGDASTALYGVAEGQIGVHGREQGAGGTLLHLVGPGFWTGEFAAATNKPRIISLVARTRARVLRLSVAQFQRIAEVDPMAWRHLVVMTVANNQRAIAVVNALRRVHAAERLAATLVNLALEVDGKPAVLRVSQDDLGVMANLSRGSVNSALAALEARSLVRRDYGAVLVTDVEALDAFACS